MRRSASLAGARPASLAARAPTHQSARRFAAIGPIRRDRSALSVRAQAKRPVDAEDLTPANPDALTPAKETKDVCGGPAKL